MKPETEQRLKRIRRYLLAGILTVAPLWVTWLVFNFVFNQLARVGQPWVTAVARVLRRNLPAVSDLLLLPLFQSVLGVTLTLVVLCLIGWLASRMFGQRIIHWMERRVLNVPLVAAVYGATKRFLAAINEKPVGVQRVVLINFPSPQMKAVGLVTRVIKDLDTGEDLAAVYVPTSPNPTSGYIEIVPVSQLVSTDWTVDEAMSFVVTGGTTSPEAVRFHGPSPSVNDMAAADELPDTHPD